MTTISMERHGNGAIRVRRYFVFSSAERQSRCALYVKHKDKGWSLTDCISFLIMRQHGADTALTSDRHFVQAGFQILLSSEPFGVAEPAVPYYGSEPVAEIKDAA